MVSTSISNFICEIASVFWELSQANNDGTATSRKKMLYFSLHLCNLKSPNEDIHVNTLFS